MNSECLGSHAALLMETGAWRAFEFRPELPVSPFATLQLKNGTTTFKWDRKDRKIKYSAAGLQTLPFCQAQRSP